MAAKVIAFKVVIEGVQTAIRNEQELADAVKRVAKAYKSSDFGSTERKEAEVQLKKLQAAQAFLKEQYEKTARAEKEAAKQAKDNAKQAARAAKDSAKSQARAAQEAARDAERLSQQRAKAQQRADDIASGSIKGLKAELRLLQDEYEDLSRAEKKTAGPDLLGRMARIQTELAQYRQEVRDTAREQDVAGGKAAGSYRALNAELVNLRRQYKELGRAEREVAGPDLLKRIDRLDTELKELDADMGQYQRNVGNYASAFEGIGGALLDLGGIDLAGLATPAGLVTALGTGAIAATAYVKELTGEYRALRNEVELLSGTTGAELDALATRTLAISETFKVGTNEVSNAANALAKNIGIGFEDALSRIEQGYVAGLDLNGEFLDSLREYPTFFAEAFGPGEEAANAFFEVIRRGSEQGVFNDKAVDAIKEVTLRLRELPTATRDALDAIGLDSAQLQQEIEQNGIGAAIATVSQRLSELEADSPEVGQALADIFGGPGEDAGLAFITSLKDIDRATGDLIDTTSEYQAEQLATLKVNQEFAAAQAEVAQAFGGTGASMDNVITKGQTLLLRFLVPAIDFTLRLFDSLKPLGKIVVGFAEDIGILDKNGQGLNNTLGRVDELLENTNEEIETLVGWFTAADEFARSFTEGLDGAGKSVNGFFRKILGLNQAIADTPDFGGGGAGAGYAEAARGIDGLTDAQRAGREAMADYTAEQQKQTVANRAEITSIESLQRRLASLTTQREKVQVGSTAFNDLTREIARTQAQLDQYTARTKASAVATEKFARDSIGFLQAELAELQKELQNATTPDQERGLLAQIIDVEGAIEKIEAGRIAIRNEIARMGDNLEPVSLIAPQDAELDALEQNQNSIERATDAFQDRLNASLEENRQLNKARDERAAEEEVERLESRAARIAEISSGIFSTFDSINSALASSSRSRSEEATKNIQRQYAARIDAAEGNAERQEELREQQAEAEARIQAAELERAKKYQTAAALASAAAGVINIIAAPTTIPDPFGSIFKGVQIAALAATTAIQVANIQRQTVAARGILVEAVGEDEDDPELLPHRARARARQDRRTERRRELAARGTIVRGWIRGQTHAGPAGGVPLTIGGQRILAEDGEKIDRDEHGATIIVNKRSAARHRVVLDEIDGLTFAGKREVLHRINTDRGYGRSLLPARMERGGYLPGPAPQDHTAAIASLQLYNEATVGSREQRTAAPDRDVVARMDPADIEQLTAAVHRGAQAGAAQGSYRGTAEGGDEAARRRAAQDRLNARTGLNTNR